MSNMDIVRGLLEAYRSQDLATADRLLSPELVFTSPYDDHIDKATYLERCFPTADHFVSQEILSLAGVDRDNVFLLYEYELRDGDRYRNAECITVRDGRVVEIWVFFGGRV
jgi:ketosteroid isomerase-like protein